MAKMLQLLFDWEYPHWMMMAGAILVAAGFIGLAFHRNRNGPVNESSRARESMFDLGQCDTVSTVERAFMVSIEGILTTA